MSLQCSLLFAFSVESHVNLVQDMYSFFALKDLQAVHRGALKEHIAYEGNHSKLVLNSCSFTISMGAQWAGQSAVV